MEIFYTVSVLKTDILISWMYIPQERIERAYRTARSYAPLDFWEPTLGNNNRLQTNQKNVANHERNKQLNKNNATVDNKLLTKRVFSVVWMRNSEEWRKLQRNNEEQNCLPNLVRRGYPMMAWRLWKNFEDSHWGFLQCQASWCL